MFDDSLTRWQKFYTDNPKLSDIPPSACAKRAAGIFTESSSRAILDLGCSTGRDSLFLVESGVKVIGVDAARSGLLLAQKRVTSLSAESSWAESDARLLPFSDATFDGVYCFGLLHEFVGKSSETDVGRTMLEIHRVLKPSGIAIIATAAGDPVKGLPHVQNFSETMFDAATAQFHCLDKDIFDDLGCTGRPDYKVWFGHFTKA